VRKNKGATTSRKDFIGKNFPNLPYFKGKKVKFAIFKQ
jgi:hypothetical protein